MLSGSMPFGLAGGLAALLPAEMCASEAAVTGCAVARSWRQPDPSLNRDEKRLGEIIKRDCWSLGGKQCIDPWLTCIATINYLGLN